MASQVVSFRLSEQEIQVLKSHAAFEGESNSSIAQRLFRGLLGVSPASIDNRIQLVYNTEITLLQDQLAALEQKLSEDSRSATSTGDNPAIESLQTKITTLEEQFKAFQGAVGQTITEGIVKATNVLENRLGGLEECLDFITVLVKASKFKAGLEVESVENNPEQVQPQDQDGRQPESIENLPIIQAIATSEQDSPIQDSPAPLPEVVAPSETSTSDNDAVNNQSEIAIESSNDEFELTTNELAVRMNCHRDTLIKARKNNRLPFEKNGLIAEPTDKKQGKEIIWIITKAE